MKRFFLFLPLLAGAALLSGCLVDGPPVVSGGAYPGYYGHGYYNEEPPGPVYGSEYGGVPYYGGGGVAVIETGGYRDRGYRDSRDRDGRRYSREGRNGNRSGGSYNRGVGSNGVPGVRRPSGLNRPNTGRGNFRQPGTPQVNRGGGGGGGNNRGGGARPSGGHGANQPKQQ